MAGVMAQRMREAGQLAAAYFCRHNDGTRNDPRYLLGTVACQLCDCNTQYKVIIGGESGVKMLLGNSKLGILELFTKLLQESLSKCFPCGQRRLVIIDALDETEYESREDFLDLIMHCFPLLPKWLVFFITSRPEDSVQFRLKKYNPCVKICAGNSDQDNFYQQHQQDIQTFLKKRIDFSRFYFTVEDLTKMCNGLFLYAHYIVEELMQKLSVDSGKDLNQLSDLFPGDIDRFFLQNFKRVYGQVGRDVFKNLFGCAIVAPTPLPVSIISYILKRENSTHDEQQAIDAVSQFVVLRTSDQTLTFLHNLIPAWLTDKNKATRKLFIDKTTAREYLRKIFVEILSSIMNESRTTCLPTDADLKDYVSCVAARFLCQNGTTDSLKAVFDCLTSYPFIERRIQRGGIEIYRLLDDLRLAVWSIPVEEVRKQEILQEIVLAIENNVLVLLECPHLLHSCLRNTSSNVVQETIYIPEVSAPWLEWYIHVFPDANIADMNCSATSPDRRTVVGARHWFLFFFDVPTVQLVSGGFDLRKDVNNGIKYLEFSPDGKFVFFGRLDKWFSVERSCVEDFPQFSGNSQSYTWCVVDPKGQCIVVKRSFASGPCPAQTCLFTVLSLWAKMEIEQSRDDEMTVSFCLQALYSESDESVSHRLEVQKYLDKTRPYCGYHRTCCYCRRLEDITRSNQQPSLASVRQLVIELYPFIFDYQVWDLQTGMSVIQQLFSDGIQLSPLKYLCHVTCAFSNFAQRMGCTGIEEAMSICNIAVANAFFCRGWVLLEQRLKLKWRWEQEWSSLRQEEERWRLLARLVGLERELKPEWSSLRQEEARWLLIARLGGLERELKAFLDSTQERKEEWKLVLVHSLNVRLGQGWKSLRNPQKMQLLLEARRFELVMEQRRKGERILYMSALMEEFHDEVSKVGICANEGFQNLLYDVIRICVSPEAKWIKAVDVLEKCFLQTVNHDPHFHNHGNPKTIICKFKNITFTNDSLYCVYSCDCSLKALSLQTGTVFTSVSGCNLIYFTRERQVGYLFHSDTEERAAILLTSLFNPFKFLAASPVKSSNVGKSIGARFCSRNTVLSFSSDSKITSWETTTSKEGITFICEYLLTESDVQSLPVKNSLLSSMFRRLDGTVQSISSDSTSLSREALLVKPGVQSFPVKNCLLSSDGRLIAIHQKTKVKLYSFMDNTGEKFPHTVYESKCEFTVPCFAFSADSSLLLFCIQDSRRYPPLYVWDVQQTVMAASFKSPGLLTIECCCFSWDKRLIILCAEYEIEIVEYAGATCRRLGVDRPYHSVKFAQCAVSIDNQFLACCIANRLLIYNLFAPNVNSSKLVLRGHLGRVEFCRFLKANRYLITYGVDGMVFVWEISKFKAVAFARITQENEKIVAMAVSPEEDIAVCFTSSDRVHMVKLRGLGALSSLKPLTSLSKGKLETAETSLRIPRQIASESISTEDDMASGSSSSSDSDSDEDMNDYYQGHDDDVYSM